MKLVAGLFSRKPLFTRGSSRPRCETDFIGNIYNDFINIVKWHINSIVPKFICGSVTHHNIAVKVNRLIIEAHNRSTALAGVSNTDIKQLWGLLKRTGNWGANKQTVFNIDPNQINDYFAKLAPYSDYDRSAVMKAVL